MFILLLHLKGSNKWMKVEHLKDCTFIFSNKNIFFIVTSFLWHTKKFFQRGLTEALVDTYLVHKYLLHSFQKWNISWIFNVLWTWHCNPNCLGNNSCKKMGLPGLQYIFEYPIIGFNFLIMAPYGMCILYVSCN